MLGSALKEPGKNTLRAPEISSMGVTLVIPLPFAGVWGPWHALEPRRFRLIDDATAIGETGRNSGANCCDGLFGDDNLMVGLSRLGRRDLRKRLTLQRPHRERSGNMTDLFERHLKRRGYGAFPHRPRIRVDQRDLRLIRGCGDG